MRSKVWLLVLSTAAAGYASGQEIEKFDGTWDATVVCHPTVVGNRQVKPFAHQMTGVVLKGQFAAVIGTEGKPGWSYLHGPLDSQGNALLRYDTLLSNTALSIDPALKVGDKITWQATAKFGPVSGSGKRLGGRDCDLSFAKRGPSKEHGKAR